MGMGTLGCRTRPGEHGAGTARASQPGHSRATVPPLDAGGYFWLRCISNVEMFCIFFVWKGQDEKLQPAGKAGLSSTLRLNAEACRTSAEL